MDPGKIYSGAQSGRLEATDRVTWKIGHGEETRGPVTGGEGSLRRAGGLARTQAASQTQGRQSTSDWQQQSEDGVSVPNV